MPGWVWRPAQLPGVTSAMPVTVLKPGGKSTVWSGVRLMVGCCATAVATTTGTTAAAMTSDFFNTVILPGNVQTCRATWSPRAGAMIVRGGPDAQCTVRRRVIRRGRTSAQEIVIFRMLAHVGGNEWALRHDPQPLRPHR